jgi:tetratricopeptide (TPR) repeat protein
MQAHKPAADRIRDLIAEALMRRGVGAGLAMLALAAGARAAERPAPEEYREPVARILGAALTDQEGWARLEHLTTRIGHRLSGSAALEEAVRWAHEGMAADGLENVRLQPVAVPHWVRGRESAEVVSPVRRPLPILGLGGSVATPPGGIEAEAVVVRDFEDLERLGRAGVEGRIVVFATTWQGPTPWEGYLSTVVYRGQGASRAAALGAVATLVRSATGRSLATPHTGALRYDEAQPKIPAAALTVEDAEWLARRAASGDVLRLRLEMEARFEPEAPSANVVAEIVGRERPEEVVVVGGHLDSWDVGEGAHDDGAGCIAAWRALALLSDLGLRPRRTLRAVLWTNEENGLRGAAAYREEAGEGVGRHVAAIEMDGGVERPVGFGFGLAGVDGAAGDATYEAALARLEAIGALLAPLDAGAVGRNGGGADIGPLMEAGVPGLALQTVGERYFDWHHTAADTLDKVEPENLQRATAMLAVMGYVLADMPERLVPEGWLPPEAPQAVSLVGAELVPPAPGPDFRATQERLLAEARARLAADPGDAEAAIWVGRRLGYLGRYREAIAVFTDGVARHPDDARFLRHRGHRWLTVRELERARADLERAADLVAGRADEVEPDGLPNERGVPTSTLQSNIRYHLGLARYLEGDWDGAAAAFGEDVRAAANPDTLVAGTYWLYLALRRLGREEEAGAALAPIVPELDVIENGDYHRLLLAFRGRVDPEALLAEAASDPAGVAFPTVGYGVAAWHLVEGRRARAEEILEEVLASPTWAAFGFLAAEAERAREAPPAASPGS